MFIGYIFPLLFLKHYKEIIKMGNQEALKDIISTTLGDKDFDLKMRIGRSREKIIQERMNFKNRVAEMMKKENYLLCDMAYIYWQNENDKMTKMFKKIEIRDAFNAFLEKKKTLMMR